MKKIYEKPVFIKTKYISADTMANDYNNVFDGADSYVGWSEFPEGCNCKACPTGNLTCLAECSDPNEC